jgi:p-hydroxybenzoate 3-monooxygenase
VGIIGAGPAGLLLGQMLARSGVDSVVLEHRPRGYVEARQRAGVLEQDVAQLLRELGVGARMDAQGFAHDGICLQFEGYRHRFDFRELVGRGLQVWAQTEVVKDAIKARLDAGLPLEFGVGDVALHGYHSDHPRITYVDAAGLGLEFDVSDLAIHDVATDQPQISYTDATGQVQSLRCDVVAGCDGFYGPSRPMLPEAVRIVHERRYPYAWLGVLADVAPSTDEVIYAHHPDGFALHSMRSATVSRLYLQVDPGEELADWSDERIWKALQTRFELPGWTLNQGPIREKIITPMRSFVAGPMRHERLFLAGDAVHIVPPTGAKGLNLAVADVVVLARALVAWLRDGDGGELAAGYDAACADRIWRTTQFAAWMTALMHTPPNQDPFDRQLQLAELRRLTSSEAAARSFAEIYTGQALPARPTAAVRR